MSGSLVRWQHPTMGETTFQDVRPGAKATGTDNDMPAAVDIIAKAMAETPGHEARHAAAGLLFDFKTVEARADLPEDRICGYVQFDFTGETWTRLRLAEHAVALLAGPVAEKAGPPAWPLRSDNGPAGDSDGKALAHIARLLELDEKQYHGLADIARTIVRHPGIKRVEQRISTLLGVGLTLTGPMLKDAHDGAWREFTEETRPRTQDELDDAERRAHYRQWMTDTLDAGVEWYEAEEQRKADRELRRRCDRIAREYEASL